MDTKLFVLCGLCALAFSMVTAESPSKCAKAKADVMILLDKSGSIKEENFIKMKNFVKRVVSSFPIGKDGVQVGAVTFNHFVTNEFNLNKHHDIKSLHKGIDSITYDKGFTYTNDGLNYLTKNSFTSGRGDRKDVTNFVIVVTDGRSTDPEGTKVAAKALQASGAIVFSVGIGSKLNIDEITLIASKPTKNFRFTLKNFDTFHLIEQQITSELCHDAVLPTACIHAQADVMFLVDKSGSVGYVNFQKMMDFLINVSSSFPIAKNEVRVGVVTFNHFVHNEFNMNEYYDLKALKKVIKSIKYGIGYTDTGAGLEYLREKSFTRKAGERKGVPNIAIVLTDGKSTYPDETKEAAKALKDTGVFVFSIGIGRGLDMNELAVIASKPTNKFRFTVKDFNALAFIKKQIAQKTCSNAGHA